MRALIVGASGFNGRALTRRLKREGHYVRGLVRNPATAPAELDEVIQGDVITGAGLPRALTDVDVAYYFVHSLEPGTGSADDRDLRAAHAFATATQTAKLPRAIYLTTLAPPAGARPPSYQRNRLAVENVLLDGVAGMTVLRSPLILGSGSRALRPYLRLVQRVPIVPLGPWRNNRIAVVDARTVEDCLVAAGIQHEPLAGSWDIPASADPTHTELARALIDVLGIRRKVLGLPVASAAVDSWLMAAITGESYRFCRTFVSANEFDYVPDQTRLVPFAGLTPRPMTSGLKESVLAWEDLPRYKIRRESASPTSGRARRSRE